jgi:hypothetical protein
MVLRKHPLFNYRGLPSWPPVWTFTGGLKNKRPRRQEIGILTEVMISNVQPADRCFLHIEHEGSSYVGCLLIEDHAFCDQIAKLLQAHCNLPIAEIGGLELPDMATGRARSFSPLMEQTIRRAQFPG